MLSLSLPISKEDCILILLFLAPLLVGVIYISMQYILGLPSAFYRWLLSKSWIQKSSYRAGLERHIREREAMKEKYREFGHATIKASCILLLCIFAFLSIYIFVS